MTEKVQLLTILGETQGQKVKIVVGGSGGGGVLISITSDAD